MKTILIWILFIILSFVKSESENIDLNDENPLAYCLKKVRQYNLDEIKDFILRNQDPYISYSNTINFWYGTKNFF